jgi:hypothetical protein
MGKKTNSRNTPFFLQVFKECNRVKLVFLESKVYMVRAGLEGKAGSLS